MSLRRIGVLFAKDLIYGSRNVIFVLAIVMPLVVSLVIGLLFGTLFSETPKLGIYDAGDSVLAQRLSDADFMDVERFESQEALRVAVESGVMEIGLVLPPNFDPTTAGDAALVYVWGQSMVKNRMVVLSAITDTMVQLVGRETPITVNTVLVGDRAEVEWQQRLLPLVVLMSVIIGGVMVPAVGMVEEKRARTIYALTVTPMSMHEVFIVKGLMGVLLSVFSGILILTLNGGWGPNPLLLVFVLASGGMLSSSFGVLLGFYIKDINTLFAVIKSTGILLYAPGIITLFPDDIPHWVAQLFPTYYIMQPVMEISQRGAGLADVAPYLVVLYLLVAVVVALLGMNANRLQVKGA